MIVEVDEGTPLAWLRFFWILVCPGVTALNSEKKDSGAR
jgi:hypothetical protein